MNRVLPTAIPTRATCHLVAAIFFGASIHSVCAARSDDSKTEALNFARLLPGAQIECTTPDGRVELLKPNESSQSSAAMLRDETLSCPLQEGVTTFVIQLPSASLLDRFTFVNENASAAGELKIAVSNSQLPAESVKWVDVDGSVVFSHKRLFKLSMLGVEARYVKLSFNVANGGRISDIGLYGGEAIDRQLRSEDVNQQLAWVAEGPTKTTHKKHRERTLDFDFASTRAKGKVVYISSGQRPTATRMIDDNEQTGHFFANSDHRPTAIIELGGMENIHRVTAIYRAQTRGRFDIYVLEENKKELTDFTHRRPIASATTKDDEDKTAVEFDPAGARYVAVRFTPFEAAATDKPFEMVEISAYGDMPMAMLDLTEAPNVYDDTSAAPFPGESGPDISSKLGVIAIPPTLPNLSP